MIGSPTMAGQPTIKPSSPITPVEYLTRVLDLVQENALYSAQIDWSTFRPRTLAMIAHAHTVADTYPAIGYVIQNLNDLHSQFWPPSQAAQIFRHTGIGLFGSYVPPVVKRLSGNLGYMQLPQSVTFQDYVLYVKTVYAQLEEISQSPVCGWIVDLRSDQGGSILPMLAAVGPLLGNGEFGAFIDNHGHKTPWFYRNGTVGATNASVFQFTPPNLSVDYSTTPVAVLTGPLTASAGEVTVISFNGRNNTKRFGTATAGLTTANGLYFLSDGAALILAEALEADRTGYVFAGVILPDVNIATASASDDAVLKAATHWLSGQCTF
jgi:C-terminal processing protease CtpA/Prc